MTWKFKPRRISYGTYRIASLCGTVLLRSCLTSHRTGILILILTAFSRYVRSRQYGTVRYRYQVLYQVLVPDTRFIHSWYAEQHCTSFLYPHNCAPKDTISRRNCSGRYTCRHIFYGVIRNSSKFRKYVLTPPRSFSSPSFA